MKNIKIMGADLKIYLVDGTPVKFKNYPHLEFMIHRRLSRYNKSGLKNRGWTISCVKTGFGLISISATKEETVLIAENMPAVSDINNKITLDSAIAQAIKLYGEIKDKPVDVDLTKQSKENK